MCSRHKSSEKQLCFMDSILWWESGQEVDKYICKNNKRNNKTMINTVQGIKIRWHNKVITLKR